MIFPACALMATHTELQLAKFNDRLRPTPRFKSPRYINPCINRRITCRTDEPIPLGVVAAAGTACLSRPGTFSVGCSAPIMFQEQRGVKNTAEPGSGACQAPARTAEPPGFGARTDHETSAQTYHDLRFPGGVGRSPAAADEGVTPPGNRGSEGDSPPESPTLVILLSHVKVGYGCHSNAA